MDVLLSLPAMTIRYVPNHLSPPQSPFCIAPPRTNTRISPLPSLPSRATRSRAIYSVIASSLTLLGLEEFGHKSNNPKAKAISRSRSRSRSRSGDRTPSEADRDFAASTSQMYREEDESEDEEGAPLEVRTNRRGSVGAGAGVGVGKGAGKSPSPGPGRFGRERTRPTICI